MLSVLVYLNIQLKTRVVDYYTQKYRVTEQCLAMPGRNYHKLLY